MAQLPRGSSTILQFCKRDFRHYFQFSRASSYPSVDTAEKFFSSFLKWHLFLIPYDEVWNFLWRSLMYFTCCALHPAIVLIRTYFPMYVFLFLCFHAFHNSSPHSFFWSLCRKALFWSSPRNNTFLVATPTAFFHDYLEWQLPRCVELRMATTLLCICRYGSSNGLVIFIPVTCRVVGMAAPMGLL